MPVVLGIGDVAGISVGHDTDLAALTGCTVVLCADGAEAAVDVRGGAPGTRETDLLGVARLVHRINAVVLTGGSAFGLAAADGVMSFLAERGHGFRAGRTIVPIVPAAVLFDLGIGSPVIHSTAESGYQASVMARAGSIEEGCVGAGTGATVGKVLGIEQAMKSGIGTAALRLSDGIMVGAIVAVNAYGDVVNPTTGQTIAGARDPATGAFAGATAVILGGAASRQPVFGNTTIGVIATDAALSRDELQRVAGLAHDGLARVVRPAHTINDGDTFFALATGRSAV
ncbi:MAG TPA: P1 family peptidase, partial [Chloroflexota bacterium]|nr:P1 family peptidase [Chloroflexota bacterium]